MRSRVSTAATPDVDRSILRSTKRSLFSGNSTAPSRLPPLTDGGERSRTASAAPRRRTAASHASAVSFVSASNEAAAPAVGSSAGGSAPPTTGTVGRKHAVWLRILRTRAQGRELLRMQGDPGMGLRELARALALQAATPGGLQDPVAAPAAVPTLEPVWACVEEMVAAAVRTAALRAAAAEPPEETGRCLREALRLLYVPAADGEQLRAVLELLTAPPRGADESQAGTLRTRPGSRRARGGGVAGGAATGTGSGLGGGGGDGVDGPTGAQVTEYFRCFPELRQHLCALVLNNVAAQLHALGRPPRDVLELLTGALVRTNGVLATGLLYNIAVVHAGVGQMRDATRVAAHAADLCAAYLRVTPAGALALASVDAADMADTYSTFMAFMATHMVAVQLLSAACAAFAGDAAQEQYHCRQAVRCAQLFLPSHHLLHRRCAARAAAAEARYRDDTGSADPPRLPLMVLHVDLPFSRSPAMSDVVLPPVSAAEAEEETGSAWECAVAEPSFTSIPLSRVLRRWGATKLPGPVRGYLRAATRRLTKQREARAAERARSGSASRGRHSPSPAIPRASLAHSRGPAPAPSPSPPPSDGAARLTPHPPAMDPEAVTTELPRRALHRYRELTGAALRYLDNLTAAAAAAEEAEGVAEDEVYDWESAQCRRRRLSAVYYGGAAPPPADDPSSTGERVSSAGGGGGAAGSALPALSVLPSATQMRTMDEALQQYSRLEVDPLPEIRAAAACCIQCAWRQRLARRARATRAAAVEAWAQCRDAATRVLLAWRASCACRPAKEMLRELRLTRERHGHATMIQRYLFACAAAEVWGERYRALCARLLEEKAVLERRLAAAVVVQSWWRMARQRACYQAQRRAARTVACAWRQHAARRALAHLRALARAARAAFMYAHRSQIVLLQRWYRACVARRAVAGTLERRQAAVAAYLAEVEETFTRDMGRWGADLNRTGRAAAMVMAVLQGARARAEVRARYACVPRVRRALAQWALRARGAHLLERLREERVEAQAQQRRREEVLAATLSIQACVRAWRWRRRRRAALDADAQRHLAASRIQATYRAHLQRRDGGLLAHRRAAGGLEAALADVEQQRQISATRIQATYRMHRTRASTRAYMQFMLVDRHVLARRIQCWWRRHQDCMASRQRRELCHHTHAQCQAEDAYRTAVVRAQSVVRMFLVRCRLVRLLRTHALTDETAAARRHGAVSWYTPYQRFAAARTVQRVWRGFAARRYTQQVRLATANCAMEQATREALHAYATIIQKFVRARLVRHHARPPTDPTDVSAGVAGACGVTTASPPVAAVSSSPQSLCASSGGGEGGRAEAEVMEARAPMAGAASPLKDDAPSRTLTSPLSEAAADEEESVYEEESIYEEEEYEEEEEEEEEEEGHVGEEQFQTLETATVAQPRTSLSLVSGRQSPSPTPGVPPAARHGSPLDPEPTLVTGDRTREEALTVAHRPSVRPSGNPAGAAMPAAASYTQAQHAAATRIQALWRGYVIRCTYEFYYEECEVEVDELGNEV